jgi:hypothetical protein
MSTRAERWIAQDEGGDPRGFFAHASVTLFDDFSVAQWDPEIGGWRVQQLTSQQFFRVQQLVASFQPRVDVRLSWHEDPEGRWAPLEKEGRRFTLLFDPSLGFYRLQNDHGQRYGRFYPRETAEATEEGLHSFLTSRGYTFPQE